MRKLPGLLLVVLLLIPFTVMAEYQVGEHVEDFTLPDAYGTDVSLYDFSDRIVVIPFWESN